MSGLLAPRYEVAFGRVVHDVSMPPVLFEPLRHPHCSVVSVARKALKDPRIGDLLRIRCYRADLHQYTGQRIYRQVTWFSSRPGTTNNLLVGVGRATGVPKERWESYPLPGDACSEVRTRFLSVLGAREVQILGPFVRMSCACGWEHRVGVAIVGWEVGLASANPASVDVTGEPRWVGREPIPMHVPSPERGCGPTIHMTEHGFRSRRLTLSLVNDTDRSATFNGVLHVEESS